MLLGYWRSAGSSGWFAAADGAVSKASSTIAQNAGWAHPGGSGQDELPDPIAPGLPAGHLPPNVRHLRATGPPPVRRPGARCRRELGPR